MLTKVRFFTHVFLGLLVGTMYWLGGNDAAVILNNASMLFFNLLVILFASTMPTVVTCKFSQNNQHLPSSKNLFCSPFDKTVPLERKVLVREHLNHWYSLIISQKRSPTFRFKSSSRAFTFRSST
jgi:hypothetical protein